MKTIFILRKPLEGNLVRNTLTHGCGGLNIDAARIPSTDNLYNHGQSESAAKSKGIYGDFRAQVAHQTEGQKLGRFPANFLLADIETAKGLDNQSGLLASSHNKNKKSGGSAIWGEISQKDIVLHEGYSDAGGASRFFKCLEEDK